MRVLDHYLQDLQSMARGLFRWQSCAYNILRHTPKLFIRNVNNHIPLLLESVHRFQMTASLDGALLERTL